MKNLTAKDILTAAASANAAENLAARLRAIPQAHAQAITADDITEGTLTLDFGFAVAGFTYVLTDTDGALRALGDTDAIAKSGNTVVVTLGGEVGDLVATDVVKVMAWESNAASYTAPEGE